MDSYLSLKFGVLTSSAAFPIMIEEEVESPQRLGREKFARLC
jgi:hypothetical protein